MSDFPRKQRNSSWNFVLIGGIILILGGIASVVWLKLQQKSINANAAEAESMLSEDPVKALVVAVNTTEQNKRIANLVPWIDISTSVKSSLRQAIDTASDSHFFKHENSVHSVAVSPQDEQFIVSSDGKGIRLWSGKSNLASQLLPNENVNRVIYSPDGKTIAVIVDRQTIKLLDAQGNYKETFRDKKSSITSVTFSPNGKYILTGNQDKTARLWDLNGNLILTLRGHQSEIDSVSFSPDGTTMLTGSRKDGTLGLWDLDGKSIQTLNIGKNLITSVAYSPDGETVIIGGTDGKVRKWELEDYSLTTLSGYQKSITSVAFNPDGQTFASSSADGTIRLWAKDGSPLETLSVKEEIQAIAFSPDGKQIISGSKNGAVRLWQGGNWEDWLSAGCNQLRDNSVFKNLQTKEAQTARNTCQPYLTANIAQAEVEQPATTDSEVIAQVEVEQPATTDSEAIAQAEIEQPATTDSADSQPPKVVDTALVSPEDFKPKVKILAKHYHHRGDEPADLELIEHFTKIIENPESDIAQKTNAYINRGVIYFRDKKYEQAIDSYTKAMENASEKQMVQIYVNRGMAYSSLSEPEYQLAVQDFDRALSIAPQYFDAYVNRGIAFASLGQYEKAIADYTKAIAIHPDNPDVHYAEAFTLALEENQQQKAIEAYTKAATLYQKEGREEYARSALEKVEELQQEI
ncbi:MAG: tetratricopeptide repeat protein [Xenococcaceae cyanobacterium]